MAQEMQAPNIGARIKEAREMLGLSQTALADHLGAGERTVQAWERNERKPRIGMLVRLGQDVDRPVSWFYEVAPEDVAA